MWPGGECDPIDCVVNSIIIIITVLLLFPAYCHHPIWCGWGDHIAEWVPEGPMLYSFVQPLEIGRLFFKMFDCSRDCLPACLLVTSLKFVGRLPACRTYKWHCPPGTTREVVRTVRRWWWWTVVKGWWPLKGSEEQLNLWKLPVRSVWPLNRILLAQMTS